MISLNDLFAGASKSESGTGVTESGAVEIGSTVAGEPTNITSSDGSKVVTVSDDKKLTVNDSQKVSEIVNAINVSADKNDEKLPTVEAVITFLAGAVTAAINFKEFTSKAAFDAFITDGGFVPTIAFVTNATPFDYTDDTGHTGTGLTWMFVVCVEENSVVTTSMINNSDISSLTGAEIAAIIAPTEDVNFVNDSDLSRIRNLPDNTTDALGGKVNTESGKGLSQNNFTNTQRSKVDNLPIDTASALNEKLDIQSVNKAVKNTNGSYTFSNSNADPEERDWKLKANSDGSITIEALDSSGNTKINGVVKIDKNGKVSAKNFSQNNYPVIASSDPVYILLSALFNGNMTEDMILRSDSRTALTFKVLDNSDNTGMAWQNTGNSYTMSVRREQVGSYGADLVISMGQDDDLGNLTEVLRLRGVDGASGTQLSVVAKALHSTEEATARGQTLMHRRNFGLYRQQVVYKSSFPNPSVSAIADWFNMGAAVYFFGVGSGTINMPEIVSSNPTIDQVVVGTEIELDNKNSGSIISFARHDTGQIFVDGNVGSTTSVYGLAASKRIKLAAVDLNNYSEIGKYCWVVT